MCLSTAMNAQEAQKTVQLYADDVSACYNTSNEYQVKVSMMDFIQLVKFNWVLQFESNVFDFKGATLTGALSGVNISEAAGNINFTWDNGTTPVTVGDGVKTDVAVLKFGVKHFPSNMANSYVSLLTWTTTDFFNLAGVKSVLTTTPPVNGKLNVTVGLTNVNVIVGSVTCSGGDANVTVASPAEGTGYMYLFNEDPDPSNWVWSTSATSSAPANSTNMVRVKDSNGCISLQKTFKITDVSPLTFTAHTQAALCNAGNGEILFNAFGGTAPYNYWVVPADEFAFVQSVLGTLAGKNATSISKYKKSTPQVLRPAGQYKVAVDDVNLCNDLTVVDYWLDVTVEEPNNAPVIVVSDILGESCYNANDGSFKVTVSEGAGGEYRVAAAGRNIVTVGGVYTFTNVAPGTYVADVKDANGCTVSSNNIVISEKEPITFAINVTNSSCGSLDDGKIEVSNILGGTAPYSVSIEENGTITTQNNVDVTGYTFIDLKPTYYSLTITDANNCTVNYINPVNSSNVIAVQSPEDINISDIEITNPLCSGDDATLKAIGVSGGTGVGYLYSIDETNWQPGNTFVVSQPFSASYTIYVKNASGNSCIVSQSTAVNEVVAPLPLTSSINTITPPTCANGEDGVIHIDIAGGTMPYSYKVNSGDWHELADIFFISSAYTGHWTINLRDANGCMIAEPYDFDITQDQNVITANADLIECAGETTVINANWTSWANGGNSRTIMYKYSLTESTVQTAGIGFIPGTTLFNAGTYYVAGFDQFGCVSEPVAVEVKENPELIISSVVANGATCFGSTKGTITVQATGGTVTNLLQYALLTDESQLNSIDESQWVDFDTYDVATTLSTVSFQVDKGVYFVAVRDNNCDVNHKNYGPITVTGYDPLLVKESFIVKTDILCAATATGSINLPMSAVSGGAGAYLFTLLDNTGTPVAGKIQQATGLFNNLSIGTYSILVEDINNCPSYTTSSFTITEPPLLTFDTDINYFSCYQSNDGLITMHVDGGVAPYTYSVNNRRSWIAFAGGSKVHVATEPGVFSVWIKDANGCIRGPEVVEIKEPAEIVPSVNVLSTISCNGENNGQIEVSATGGWDGISIFNYKVDNGIWTNETTINGLTGGNHTLYVKDVAAYSDPYQMPNEYCIASLEFNIAQPEPILYDVVVSDVKCKGGNDGAITVSVISGLNPFFSDDNDDTNDGYDITLSGDGYNQTVRTGIDNKATFGGLLPSLYTVNISDANGCSLKPTVGDNVGPYETIESFQVSEPVMELTVVPELVNNTLCFGSEDGKIKIIATGGTAPYKYYAAYTILADGTVMTPVAPVAGSNEWKDSNEFAGAAGTWVVWVMDANGCINGGSTNTSGDPVDTWTIQVNQAAQITWNFATPSFTEPTANGKENGKIHLSGVTGGSGQYTAIVTGLAADKTIKAYTQAISGATGWTINNVAASDENGYTVKVFDGNNCQSEQQNIIVTQPEILSVTLDKMADSFTCPDVLEGLIEATATGGVAPYTYSLYKDGKLHTGFVAPSTFLVQIGHLFKVVVKDAKGNTAEASIDINQIQPVVANLSDVSCFGTAKASAVITATGEPGRTFVVQYASVVEGVEGTLSDAIPFDEFTTIADLDYGITYRFYVADNVGCTSPVIEQVFSPVSNALDVAVVKLPEEIDAALTISGGTAPYSYQVGNGNILPADAGSFNLTNLTAPQTIVTVYDAHGCFVVKNIDVAPISVVATPSNGNNMATDFNVVLTFNRSVTIGAGDITGGTYTPGTGNSFTVAMTGVDSQTLTLSLGTGIKDAAGNAFDGKVFTYKVGDHIAPTLIVTPPTPPIGSVFNVILKFSEPVQGITLGSLGIVVTNGKVTKITGMGDTYTLTITSKEQTDVTIVLNNQIKDISANANPFAGRTLTYKTGDFTAPLLVTKAPTLSNLLSNNHPTFSMTFSEDVKQGAGGYLRVYKVGTTTTVLNIPITASMIKGKVVTVDYTTLKELEANTRYYVKVDGSALTDLTGNKFIGVNDNTFWIFKTGPMTGTDPYLSLEFNVYPNPFVEYVNIDNASQLTKVVVTNIAGQTLKTIVNPANRIQLNELRSGIYFISLYMDDEIVATEKIVKK